MKKFYFLLSTLLFLSLACQNSYRQLLGPNTEPGPLFRVMPTDRPWRGSAQKGFAYLVNEGYVGSGVPFSFMEKGLKDPDTVLRRQGINARLSYIYNGFEHANGTQVVSGNCFSCHASPFMDTLSFGLGNSFSDFTEKLPGNLLKLMIRKKYGKNSAEWEAFYDFGTCYQLISSKIKTSQIGLNSAFRLEEACVSLRDPIDLSLGEEAQFVMSDFNIASDVPPLWNVRKKDALYYNGMGRGDFRKLLMQASVLGIKDSSAAREVLRNFDDVMVWLESLQAPKFPHPIDAELAKTGKMLFEDLCQKCHGKYGEFPSYPNKIVSLEEVKTDPLYARYFLQQSGLPAWYNRSWFAQSDPTSELKPSAGYIAPPLDGIWATAPYLHNGSVPTLEELLNSEKRPDYWRRSEESTDYDFEKIGWQYQIVNKADSKYTYDTQVPGYSNEGHYFGDTLDVSKRKALIEYLKTL